MTRIPTPEQVKALANQARSNNHAARGGAIKALTGLIDGMREQCEALEMATVADYGICDGAGERAKGTLKGLREFPHQIISRKTGAPCQLCATLAQVRILRPFVDDQAKKGDLTARKAIRELTTNPLANPYATHEENK